MSSNLEPSQTSQRKILNSEFYVRLIIEVLFLGLLVAIGQKYIDSKLAPQTAIDVLTVQNRLNTKKEVYFEAIALLNRHLGHIQLTLRPNSKPDTAFRNRGSVYPTELEFNNCFAKLCVYSDNPEIPTAYFHLLTDTGIKVRPILQMEEFVNMIRKDLGNGNAIIDTVGDRYKYIEVHLH